jgi:flagellar protein FlgJ
MEIATLQNALQVPATTAGKSSGKNNPEDLQKIKKACADFESLLICQLLKTMRRTVPRAENGTNRQTEDTYTMLMDRSIAECVAAGDRGLGLQNMLREQLLAGSGKYSGGGEKSTKVIS